MCTRKLCLALMVVLGYVGSQASGAFLAAYWDENYATHWSDLDITIEIRDYFEAAGYEILDADQLKEWMDDRIADQAASVVIFCPDLAPETVVETNTAERLSSTATSPSTTRATREAARPTGAPADRRGFSDSTPPEVRGTAAIL